MALVAGCQAQPRAPIDERASGIYGGLCNIEKGREATPDLCARGQLRVSELPVVIVHGLAGNPFNGKTAREWEAEPPAAEDQNAYLRAAMMLSSGCRPCDTLVLEAAQNDAQWSEQRVRTEVFAPVHAACRTLPEGHALGFCCGNSVPRVSASPEQRLYVAHLPPFQTSSVRAECLLAQLDVFRALYHAPQVHAIGHSQGGVDVFVAARADQPSKFRDMFVSVTAIQAPFRGTPVATFVRAYLQQLVAQGVDIGAWLTTVFRRVSLNAGLPTGAGDGFEKVYAGVLDLSLDREETVRRLIEAFATWWKAQSSDNVSGVDLWTLLDQHAGGANVEPLNPRVRYQTFAGLGIPSVEQFVMMFRQSITEPDGMIWTGLTSDVDILEYVSAYMGHYLERADASCQGTYPYPIAPRISRLAELPSDQRWRLRRVRPELGLPWQAALGAMTQVSDIEPNDGMVAVASAGIGQAWTMPLGMLQSSDVWMPGRVLFRGCLPAEHGDPFGHRSTFDGGGFSGADQVHRCTGFSYLCFLRSLIDELAATES
ncbi:MAG: hypothetical protein H6715_05295 [Myxococcales bacterium]|nr:hypothetical protein [Myxococcales bacterium]MCB9709398.1 hypothetical protein [Myxococcales bacterium]